MRNFFAVVLAVGFGGTGLACLYFEQYLWGAALLAAAAALVVPMFLGHAGGDLGSAMNVVDFVRNPADAIVEAAVDRYSAAVDTRKKQRAEESAQHFDADAAFQRYLDRKAAAPDLSEPAHPPATAPRSFGRKGLEGA